VFLVGLGAAAQTQPDSVWTPLSNGTDLAGWKNNGEEKWVAEQARPQATAACFFIRKLPVSIPNTDPTSKACK